MCSGRRTIKSIFRGHFSTRQPPRPKSMSTNTSHYSRVRVGYPSPFTDAARSIKRQRPNHSCYFPLRHRQRPTDPPPPTSPSVSFSDSSSPPLLRSPATVARAPLSLSVKPCHSEFLLQTDWRADATPLCVRPFPSVLRWHRAPRHLFRGRGVADHRIAVIGVRHGRAREVLYLIR